MTQRAVQKDLDRQIMATHKRFVKAMDGRLDGMTTEMKETYFSVLSKLTLKLEDEDKPLRDVAQEMMAEAMTEVLQMVQG
jgi:hypothetical protein